MTSNDIFATTIYIFSRRMLCGKYVLDATRYYALEDSLMDARRGRENS